MLTDNELWNSDYIIKVNRNIRGQSISFFIYDETNVPKYIAKFFDYLKNIQIPKSINIEECENADDLVDKLSDADDFMDDIETVSELLYYRKRSFDRYIEVCSEEDTGFPIIYAVNSNLRHDNSFYGVLIEEAIKGITLEDFLKSEAIDSKDNFAIDFLWEMSLIIEKYIKYGIVHRDISPDNIMVSSNKLIVIDPGMVKFIDKNSTELGYIMGKRHYTSPEQYYGYAVNANFTSDLYSIGLITFEIISGINPLKFYIDKSCMKPHEELLDKFDRELEDIFFKDIEETERNQQLFYIINKLVQVEKVNRFDDIASLQEAIKVIKEE